MVDNQWSRTEEVHCYVDHQWPRASLSIGLVEDADGAPRMCRRFLVVWTKPSPYGHQAPGCLVYTVPLVFVLIRSWIRIDEVFDLTSRASRAAGSLSLFFASCTVARSTLCQRRCSGYITTRQDLTMITCSANNSCRSHSPKAVLADVVVSVDAAFIADRAREQKCTLPNRSERYANPARGFFLRRRFPPQRKPVAVN